MRGRTRHATLRPPGAVLLILATLVSACTAADPDKSTADPDETATPTLHPADADGDGCPDFMDDIPDGPPREETCDGLIDEDCDGAVDEADAVDAGAWYLDLDGDGFGRSAEATVGCVAPAQHVAVAGDCDDSSETVHPDALELPGDDIDQDCDQQLACFEDLDGDGYGSAELRPTGGATCAAPSRGLAAVDGDCDDDPYDDDAGPSAASNHPGAPLFPDLDGDGHGAGTASDTLGADCIVPSGTSLRNDDCADDPGVEPAAATMSPAAVELCDGLDNDCNPLTASAGEIDADGDGYLRCDVVDGALLGAGTLGGGDCQDEPAAHPLAAAIHPHAQELCDGVDNDCDARTTELDLDGDGWVGCSAVDGTQWGPEVLGGDDCSDDPTLDPWAPTVFPGAEEFCDGLDTDCDPSVGAADELDSDGDGYLRCDTGTAVVLALGVLGGLDCADDPLLDPSAAEVHPGAAEICGNALDEDCDPATPDVFDADLDHASCTIDCDDGDDRRSPLHPEICGDGLDNDCDGLTDTVDAADCDADGDGVGAETDNCAEIDNVNQADDDLDGLGDACDADDDGDGLADLVELAVSTDPLDPDTDGDGVCDGPESGGGRCDPGPDVCPLVSDVAQIDTDGDGQGDVCDDDDDGDGLNDALEAVAGSDPLLSDSDFDGVGDYEEVLDFDDASDPADPDSDGDGLCDGPGDGDSGGGAQCTPGDPCPADPDLSCTAP